MKRLLTFGVATVVAAVPAVLGLAGNQSFAQSVPVHVPAQAVQAQPTDDRSSDDKGAAAKHLEPGDDNGGATRTAEPGDDNGGATRHPEAGDDKGGVTRHAEPGDDNGGATRTAKPVPTATNTSDDHGGRSGGGGDDGSGHR